MGKEPETPLQDQAKDINRESKERIVSAAIPLFSKKGYHNTGMREIAREAGMNVASLYQFVSSKDDILVLFYHKIHESWLEVLDPLLGRMEADPVDQMRVLIRSGLEACLKLRDEIFAIYTESRHMDRESIRMVTSTEIEFIERLEELIRRGVQAGKFRARDPYMSACIVQYLLILQPLRGWSFQRRYTFNQIVDLVTDFIFNALGVEDSP